MDCFSSLINWIFLLRILNFFLMDIGFCLINCGLLAVFGFPYTVFSASSFFCWGFFLGTPPKKERPLSPATPHLNSPVPLTLLDSILSDLLTHSLSSTPLQTLLTYPYLLSFWATYPSIPHKGPPLLSSQHNLDSIPVCKIQGGQNANTHTEIDLQWLGLSLNWIPLKGICRCDLLVHGRLLFWANRMRMKKWRMCPKEVFTTHVNIFGMITKNKNLDTKLNFNYSASSLINI